MLTVLKRKIMSRHSWTSLVRLNVLVSVVNIVTISITIIIVIIIII